MIQKYLAGLAISASAVALSAVSPTAAIAQVMAYDIPAGELRIALDAYASQSGREVIYRVDDVRGVRSPGARGPFDANRALDALLAGTGFVARADDSGAVAIVRRSNPASGEFVAGDDAVDLAGEIVVTGTNIRGIIPESSPLTVLDREELDARGATTAEQAVNTFTQNFNSVNANSTSADRAGFFNSYGLNGIDLRGLGPGTTLVLLNGRRLSGSANGRAVDVSQIPLAAVSRIELLTDSASSVYGSDAVGGVVNFILLDRFEGVEARAAYGMTDDGALHEYRGALTGGLNWSSGNLIASATYLNRSALTADERSFSRGVGGIYTLSTPYERAGAFASVRQEIGDRVTLTADGLYNRRTGAFNLFRDLGISAGRINNQQSFYDQESDTWFGSAGATWRATDALTFDLIGSYSRVNEALGLIQATTINNTLRQDTSIRSETWDITGRAGGKVLSLPGGDLSFSLGGGATGETIANRVRSQRAPAAATITEVERARDTYYGFGELNVPLIGADMAIAGVHRLEINLSARYSDYSDFGNNFSPKIGILWSVTRGFNLRGSYGRTFRAPYLADLGALGAYQIFDVIAQGYPAPRPGAPRVGLYIDQGVDSDLGPETSNLLALGVDLRPPSVPRLSISLTYVSIDYSNRIARGDAGRGTGYILQPQLYQDLYNYAPTREDFAEILGSSILGLGSNVTGFDLANLDAITANVGYILDNRLRNIAESRQQAVDATIGYGFARGGFDYVLGANATYILEAQARTVPSSPSLPQSNILGRPVSFRANAFAGLSRDGFTARLTANYVGAYDNPFTPASPVIDDWTTFDLTASYDFGEGPGFLRGLAIYFSMQNLLDSDPPFVADAGVGVTDGLSEPIGHDPFNASPLGRFISIELRKRF